MPKGSLPGFVHDVRTNTYFRVGSDGALSAVSRDEVLAALRSLATVSERMLGDLAVAVAEKRLTQSDGVLAGAQLLKDLYNANSALARGGWRQMTFAAWGRNGQILRGEYAYWNRFMTEIAAGNLSESQIRARAALYVGKAYSRFWAEDRILKLESAKWRYEQWIDMDDLVECSDCHDLAALGKVPAGTLKTVPGAGETRCLGACRCLIIYF